MPLFILKLSEMNNDASRTFHLAGLVVFILLLMHLLPDISVGGTKLRPVDILSQLEKDGGEKLQDVIPPPKAPKQMALERNGKKVDFTEVWPKGVEPIIDYSDGQPGGMDAFYEALSRVKTLGRPVRIAWWGDSYIEGDMVSCDIRQRFQSDFGGYGVGWVDCGTPIIRSRRSIQQEFSGIEEHVVVEKPFDENRESLAERYYTATPGASCRTYAYRYYPNCQRWTSAQLFFRAARPMTIEVATGTGQKTSHTFNASSSVQHLTTRGPWMNSIKYTFPDITQLSTLYGMALESGSGVILDNFSMRGSSGVTLERMPAEMLADFHKVRPYDLIILQFGLNNAVEGNSVEVLKAYINKLKRSVMHLKKAFPEASILIMSVPDREQRGADGIHTLPEVKQLVSLQQQLAADCHVAFLNFYRAMGGEGSVKALVEQDYANKDYTHLSFGGGKIVANKVYPSFPVGLKNYLRKKKLMNE